jgi:hypothetical protein
VVWGDESKPPLVLQNGSRDHARGWDFVAWRIQTRPPMRRLPDEESGIRA